MQLNVDFVLNFVFNKLDRRQSIKFEYLDNTCIAALNMELYTKQRLQGLD